MAQIGGTVRWIIEADSSQFDEKLNDASNKAEKFSQTLQKQDGKSSLFQNLTKNASESQSALTNIGKSLSSVAWGTFSAGATTAAAALTTLISKGIQGTDFLETARVQMSGLTGSIEAGNTALSKAAKFWQNNPFDRFTVTSATQQLIQFGRTVNQLDDDLSLLGDISLSTSTPLDELARYFARTAASGRAMTMDIEMMSDRGIPIYQKLAEVTGKTTQGIREMASAGEISFEIFREALERAVNPEAMEQFEETLARQKDRLSGSISILSGDLAGYKIINDELVISANGLEKAYTRLLKTLSTSLRGEKLRESMEKLGESFARIIDKIEPLIPLIVDKLSGALEFVANHSSALIPILGGVLAVFGKFGASLPGASGIIGSVGNSFTGLVGSIKSLVKTNPLLATFIGLFGAGFVSGLKNSEEFRKSVGELMTSLGDVLKSLMPVIQAFIKVFVQLVSSKAVIGILQAIVKVLTLVANVISKIPTDVLTGLITSLLMFRMVSVSPIAAIATGISILVGSISALVEEAGGLDQIIDTIGQVFNNIGEGIKSFVKSIANVGKNLLDALSSPIKKAVNFLKEIPKTLVTIGNNIMVGLFNGLVEGSKKIYKFVKDVANSIVNTFKSVLGIHSPSTVMESQGKFVVLGLANGITKNSSIVEKAMDALASDVISASEKIISTKVEFGLLDYNGEYKAWKKISNLFAKGSTQYAQAMEKMEDARKSVNLQIIKLQNEYNDTLDTTISKIASMYGTFEKVDLSGGMDISEITSNLDQQVTKLGEYARAQEIISNLDLDPKFIEELMSMGVEATNELSAIAAASSSELSQLNDLWVKKQEIANKAAITQTSALRRDTLSEISKLKDGIDGETVEVSEVGGRLVSNIGDGITGALPTLESAFSQLDDYIAEQMKQAGDAIADSNAGINPEDVADSVANGLNSTVEGIKGEVEKFAQGLVGPIIAVLGVGLFTKIFGKGISTEIGDSIGNVFSSLGKIGKAGKDLKNTQNTITQVTQVTQGVSKSAESITTAGQQMTKAQSAMKTMRSGILNIILLAGAIAAMGIALKIAYESIPNDIAGLTGKMIVMAGVVGAMGTLAALGGKFDDSIKAGLKLIAIIAGEIALTALAIAAANFLIPDDINLLSEKMAVMGVVIAGMGTLAGIAGSLDDTIMDGLKAIAIIAGEIALTGIALGVANAMIPDDLGSMIAKLGVMGLAIVEFGVLAGIISAIPIDLKEGLITIVAIAGEIALVGLALGVVDRAIQSDFDVFMGKLGIMGLAITEFGVLAGVIGAVMSTGIGAVFMGAGLVALLGICGGIVATAVAVGEIDKQIPADIEGVKSKIDLMRDVIQTMITSDFGSLIDNLGNAINIGLIGTIAEGFAKLGETLRKIGELEIDATTIEAKVETIKKCIESLASLQTGGFWKNLENAISTTLMTKTVENIHDIVSKISQCVIILSNLDKTLSEGKSIDGYVDMIKRTVEVLGQIQAGGFWKNLSNATSTSLMTKTVENIHEIVTKIGESATTLFELDKKLEGGKSLDGYVDTIKRTVEVLGRIQGGDFWEQLNNTAAIAMIKKSTQFIGEIVTEVSDIISKLKNLDEDYGDGQAEEIVKRAIEITQSIAGVDVGDEGGWFRKSHAEKLADNVVHIKDASSLIAQIIDYAKVTFENIKAIGISSEDEAKAEVQKAVNIINALGGANVESSGGWFQPNKYKDLAKNLEDIKGVAEKIAGIIDCVRSVSDGIRDFNKGGGSDLPAYVEEANTIISSLADIQIDQSWVSDTADKSNSLNTTAGNVGTIIGSAVTIVENIKKFAEIGVDGVVAIVNDANKIIQALAKIEIKQTYLEETSKNAGYLNTTSENIKNMLSTAEGIVEKITAFRNSTGGVDGVKSQIKDANDIIAKFAEINIDGDKDYAKISTNATSLNSIVSVVKEIVEKAGATLDAVKKFVSEHKLADLQEDIVGENGINKILSTIAQIRVQGLGDGEETINKLDQVKSIIDKVKLIAESMNGTPEVMAEKLTNIETIIAFIKERLSDLPKTLSEFDGSFVEVGTTYADKFTEGWTSRYEAGVENGKTMAGKYAEGIKSTYDQFKQMGSNLQGELWGGIEAKMDDEYHQGAALAGKILEGLKSKLGEFESVGKNAIQGFINGANSGNPYNAGAQIADKFLQGLKDRGKQGSPWKTTIQSGAWAVEGLINGLKKEQGALVNEAHSLADEVIEALDLSDVSLSPSLDADINPYISRMPDLGFDTQSDNDYNRERKEVVINQTNNNYTQYSLERLNNDLAWQLSKV